MDRNTSFQPIDRFRLEYVPNVSGNFFQTREHRTAVQFAFDPMTLQNVYRARGTSELRKFLKNSLYTMADELIEELLLPIMEEEAKQEELRTLSGGFYPVTRELMEQSVLRLLSQKRDDLPEDKL